VKKDGRSAQGRCFIGKFLRAAGFQLYTLQTQSKVNPGPSSGTGILANDVTGRYNSYILPCFNVRLYFHGFPPYSVGSSQQSFQLYTLQIQLKVNPGPSSGTGILADDVTGRYNSYIQLPCFNARLYFHGFPPHSMSELPTDTPFPALHVTMARRNFPKRSPTGLLHRCQAENFNIDQKTRK
jgi:hypothetical protein